MIKFYFVSSAITKWIDLFIRNEYREDIFIKHLYRAGVFQTPPQTQMLQLIDFKTNQIP